MYTVEGLIHGIERAEHNIGALKKAIADERQTIADYKIMIANIQEAEQKKVKAQSHVEVIRDVPE